MTTPDPRPQPRPSPITDGPTRSDAEVTAACSWSRRSIARRPFRKGSTAGRPDRPPRPGRPPAVCLPAQPSAGSKSSDLQLASNTLSVRSDAMGHRRSTRAPSTPLADALARVGDRWTLLVVAALLEGAKRFNELQDELDGIAPNVLSGRLKLLGEQGLVVARAYSERPPRFVYELTASGPRAGRRAAAAGRLGRTVGRRRRAAPARALRRVARGALVVPGLRAGGRRRRRGRRRPRLSA